MDDGLHNAGGLDRYWLNLGNAEQTYVSGMAALLLPSGTLLGMILLSLIATRARSIEASTVREIIERRFGPVARSLATVSLVLAYLVIVTYQFNAGGFARPFCQRSMDLTPFAQQLQCRL